MTEFGSEPAVPAPKRTTKKATSDALPSFVKLTAGAASAGWQEYATLTDATVNMTVKKNGTTLSAPYPENPIISDSSSRAGNIVTYQCDLNPNATQPADSFMPDVAGLEKSVGEATMIEALAALGINNLDVGYTYIPGGSPGTIDHTEPRKGESAPENNGEITIIVYNPTKA